jgi:hypothetical protein
LRDCVSLTTKLVGISFALSIPFILVAVYIEWLKDTWKKLRRVWIKWPLLLIAMILMILRYVKLFGIDQVSDRWHDGLKRWWLKSDSYYERYYESRIMANLDQGVSDSDAEESDSSGLL